MVVAFAILGVIAAFQSAPTFMFVLAAAIIAGLAIRGAFSCFNSLYG